ncbi:MAG: helix-turn-helix transcriptional regulator [Thermoproteota archaeon]|nr:helix-turn-helix transcriptional regulator [Thermoproteota archaeon]
MSETFKKQIVERMAKNFLDILMLRLIHTKPMWGYKIKKEVQRLFGIQLRHGALYPLLNQLEANGLLRSRKDAHGGRVRKVYEVTSKGTQLINAYYEFLKEQLQKQDITG